MAYKVNLTYFKQTGKYYAEGDYVTERENLWEIFGEVKTKLDKGDRPGLVDGKNTFYAVINVPDHPKDHPFLIVPGREEMP
jgi:hypothetical protein